MMLKCYNFAPEIINSSNRTQINKWETISSLIQSTHIASHWFNPSIFQENPNLIPS